MSDFLNANNPAHEIAEGIQAGKISISEVVGVYRQRLKKYAKELNAFICFDEEHLELEVNEAEGRLKAAKKHGKKLPLAGVPIAIKDNIVTKKLPTTCGSKILENFVSIYDATVIQKLKAAGALIFGKTNCDEFAMGSSNENSAYGAVKNPWDLTRVPGGSSGGSAAAVAAGLAPLALGSDTGGSIRQPASFCGIVGLKPTYGRVSRYGLVAYGSSLDQIGPLSKGTLDAALVLDVISGFDANDSTSLDKEVTKSQAAILAQNQNSPSLKGKKLGVLKQLTRSSEWSSDFQKVFQEALREFEKMGAQIKEVDLPHLQHSIATYYILATAEASANLARYDGVRYGLRTSTEQQSLNEFYQANRSQGFGREVKQRIMLGTFVLSSGYYDAYYAKATTLRKLISQDFKEAFAGVDFLLSPSSPTSAFKLGEKITDPIAMYLADICTIPVNLAKLPAISVPCGVDSAGLPLGLQIISPWMQEEKLLGLAHAFEQHTGWWQKLMLNFGGQ